MRKQTVHYLTLKEASKITPYQQEYLSLLCRRKQIKAIKINRKWHTTEEWLNAYLKVYKTDDLIQIQTPAQKLKKLYYPIALGIAMTLLLLVTSYFMLESKYVHTAEHQTDTTTRVLGAETIKE